MILNENHPVYCPRRIKDSRARPAKPKKANSLRRWQDQHHHQYAITIRKAIFHGKSPPIFPTFLLLVPYLQIEDNVIRSKLNDKNLKIMLFSTAYYVIKVFSTKRSLFSNKIESDLVTVNKVS